MIKKLEAEEVQADDVIEKANLEEIKSRLIIPDGQFRITADSKLKTIALTLMISRPSHTEIQAAMHRSQKKFLERGLDHVEYEKQLEKVATTTIDNFVRKRLFPLTLYVT
jgi:hypothetical protein